MLTAKGAAQAPYTLLPVQPAHAAFLKRIKSKARPHDQDIHVVPGPARSGVWATWGFGPWLPFLPRRLAAKLTMIDALESIQQAVTGAHQLPWPGEAYQARSQLRGDTVRLWFEDPGGTVMPVGSFDVGLAAG